ncbi:MAG TPA: hypothetical protein VFS21_37885 [Roseiflexaceae bacterium]|nr:hypothetical protein [Roseiflexaceae bacterium]
MEYDNNTKYDTVDRTDAQTIPHALADTERQQLLGDPREADRSGGAGVFPKGSMGILVLERVGVGWAGGGGLEHGGISLVVAAKDDHSSCMPSLPCAGSDTADGKVIDG